MLLLLSAERDMECTHVPAETKYQAKGHGAARCHGGKGCRIREALPEKWESVGCTGVGGRRQISQGQFPTRTFSNFHYLPFYFKTVTFGAMATD